MTIRYRCIRLLYSLPSRTDRRLTVKQSMHRVLGWGLVGAHPLLPIPHTLSRPPRHFFLPGSRG